MIRSDGVFSRSFSGETVHSATNLAAGSFPLRRARPCRPFLSCQRRGNASKCDTVNTANGLEMEKSTWNQYWLTRNQYRSQANRY